MERAATGIILPGPIKRIPGETDRLEACYPAEYCLAVVSSDLVPCFSRRCERNVIWTQAVLAFKAGVTRAAMSLA